ncbi:MAG: hypothetical protein WEB04_01345 [Dehalococcoidia bacterium]
MFGGKWQSKRVLITVRTYPTPANKGAETSCTAGITDEGQWIRLFPINYRQLEPEQKFHKYDWVNVRVAKASDPRPESYTVDLESIEIESAVKPSRNWQARKEIVLPLEARSLCSLKRERDEHKHPTLGIFKPREITRLVIEPDDEDWTPEEKQKLRQPNLFNQRPVIELTKLPFRFSYEFVCNDAGCQGHKLSCTDWELGAAFIDWRNRYGARWEEKFCQKFERQMIHERDTRFYVGTVAAHPHIWIIIGLFYPKPS